MSEVPKEKQTECKEVFDLYDTDKDGCISNDKLETICLGLGAFVPHEDIGDFSSENTEGKLNFEQFMKFFSEYYTKKIDKKELLDAFEFLDKEKKGVMQADDLKHALMVLGDTLTEKEADELLGQYIGKDGNIDYKKFVNEISK